MKYFYIFFLIMLLTAPLESVLAEETWVTNNISNSQVVQFIIIKCDSEECLSWLKENKELFAGSDVAPQVADAQKPIATVIGEAIVQTAPNVEKIVSTEETVQASPIAVVMSETAKPIVNAREILINEIMATPASGQTEWIELYNTLNVEVDLNGWKLVEGSGKETVLSGLISSAGYAVFEKSSLNNSGDKIQLVDDGGQLVDEVNYGDWDDGNIEDNAPASSSGNTIVLIDGNYKESEILTPNRKNILQITIPEITPTALPTVIVDQAKIVAPLIVQPIETTAVVQTVPETTKTELIAEQKPAIVFQFSDKVRVNEILADPAGSDDFEWIELYNAGETDVDLFGWTLDDSEGGSNPHKIDGQTIIKAKDYLVFKKEETGLSLNNSTDEARLLDPNKIVVSKIKYANTKENVSWSFLDDGIQETAIVTSGMENKKVALQLAQYDDKEVADKVIKTVKKQNKIVDYYEPVNLNEVKNVALKKKVKIRGQVIALPGVFSKNQIYLAGVDDQNEMIDGVGLQVYFSKANWPELKLGDVVEVLGVVSESNGERRVLLQNKNNIKVIGFAEEEKLFSISSTNFNEENVGVLAGITGELVEKKPNNLVFSDEQGEFNVILKKGANIDVGKFQLGDKVELVGIVGGSDNNYRLMPRRQDDLENLTWSERAVAGEGQVGDSEVQTNHFQNKVAFGLGFGLIIILMTIAYLFRQRLFEVVKKLRPLQLLKRKKL